MSDSDAVVLENLRLVRDAILAAPAGQVVKVEIRGRVVERHPHELPEIMDMIDRLERKTATKPTRNYARIKR